MEVIKNSGKIFGNTVICKNLGVDYGPMNKHQWKTGDRSGDELRE